MKTYALVEIANHKIGRDRYGNMVFHVGDQPPAENPLHSRGLVWEEVEDVFVRHHKGPARYIMGQPPTARVHRIIGLKDYQNG